MSYILLIESSQKACSVALSHEGNVIDSLVTFEEKAHASVLPVFVDEILKKTGILFQKLTAVAVSQGPGSYTGLRIGVSTAKGICYGLNIPLIAIDTLKILCLGFLKKGMEIPDDSLLCPMVDARRMEVYTALYNLKLERTGPIEPKVIEQGVFKEFLLEKKIFFFGDGAHKCKNTIIHGNAVFMDDIFPLAENMAEEAQKQFLNKSFVDTAYFEPYYLKEFIATISKKDVYY